MKFFEDLKLIFKASKAKYRLGRNRDIPEREFTMEERYKLAQQLISASPDRKKEIIRIQADKIGFQVETDIKK
jgi:hypothetical protein